MTGKQGEKLCLAIRFLSELFKFLLQRLSHISARHIVVIDMCFSELIVTINRRLAWIESAWLRALVERRRLWRVIYTSIVVRTYSGKGAAETIGLVIASKKDIKKLMRSVKVFVDYSVVKTEDGGFTVTVSKTEKAAATTTAVARDWILKNTSKLKADPPKAAGGEVYLSISP